MLGLPQFIRSEPEAQCLIPHRENPEREGFEPSWRVTPPTAFPDCPSGVQGGAPTGTPYSDSKRLVHHKAGEGTRVGSALGLDFRAAREGWSATATSGDMTLVCARDSSPDGRRVGL